MNWEIKLLLSLFPRYLIQDYFKQCQTSFDSAFDSLGCVCAYSEVETIYVVTPKVKV